MANPLKPNPLIAVDTNVPLDLAEGKEDAFDALAVIRRRLRPGRVLVPPTVFQELVYLTDHGDTPDERDRARRALRSLAVWELDLVNLVPVGHGIVERIAAAVMEARLIPAEEYNDALVLAEAGLLECAVLLSGDGHLRQLDFPKAMLVLKSFDVEMPIIATPREIVAKFDRR